MTDGYTLVKEEPKEIDDINLADFAITAHLSHILLQKMHSLVPSFYNKLKLTLPSFIL